MVLKVILTISNSKDEQIKILKILITMMIVIIIIKGNYLHTKRKDPQLTSFRGTYRFF